jgi:uncharacterized repeat protein (TIGR01451 family)
VTDSGQTPYTGAAFADPLTGVLDDAAYNNDASATAGSVSFTSPNLTWSGNLSVGASATITYSVTVNNPDTGNKTLGNTVTSATTGSNCPASGGDALCTATVTVVAASTLTITQTTAESSATVGSVVHYTITLANSGLTPFVGATFTDPLSGVLDDAAYNNNAVATSGAAVFTSPLLTWTGNVPASGSVTITFSVTVKSPDTGDKILTSTITSVSIGNNCLEGSTDPRCTTSVGVAVLAISNTSDVTSTTPSGVVRFTATFTNSGQVPYNEITIASNITDVLDDATPNGDQTATSGTLELTATGISWTGDIPVGGTVTVTGTVTVDDPDTGNQVLASTLVTAAAGSNCPAGGTDPACSVNVTVLTPGLTISQSADTSAAVPGQKVTYTVTVADTGQTPYTGVSVTDTLGVLDDAVYNNDAAASSGTVSFGSPVLTWTGDLAAGATVTITFSVTADNPDNGDKLLVTSLASTAAGSSCLPGDPTPGCDLTIPVLTPALTITSTDPPPTTPGATLGYTVTIDNTGQTPFSGVIVTDSLAGVLDDAAYNNDGSATAGSVSFTSPDLTWTGDLAVGASVTVTFSVTVDNPDTGDHVLTSVVTSGEPGSNCQVGSTDPRCVTTIDVATLTIANTANVSTTTPGSTVGYTVTIRNTGQTSYDDATVTDPLSGVLDDAAYNDDGTASNGSVDFASPDLTWTGSLAPGDGATITFTVTVNDPDTGDKTLTSTITSAASGNNCPDGGSDPACTASVTVLVPALTITKTAAVSTATPGSTVGFTITVDDTGQTPYTGASVTDALTGVLPDAAYNNDATASSGSVDFASPVLTWTGDLTPGQTVTISFSVTVNNPDTGGRVLTNTAVSAASGGNCPDGGSDPACTATVDIISGDLTITVPGSASLGSADPGGTAAASLGTVQVTDNRGFGANWTATVSATAFTTGTGVPRETIPVGNVSYNISGLSHTTGSATFSDVPVTTFSTDPQAVVSATNVAGNTSATWEPLIEVHVPPGAIAGTYTATITHSAS